MLSAELTPVREPGLQLLSRGEDICVRTQFRVEFVGRVPGGETGASVHHPRMPAVARASLHQKARRDAHGGCDGAIGGTLSPALERVEDFVHFLF